MISVLYRHVFVLGGMDANAHFAEARGSSVGEFGLEDRTDTGGDCFAAFLEQANLFLPSTFADFHEGESRTWHNNITGAGARCDYCFLPAEWRVGKIASYLLPSLDGAQKGIDHTPLATEVKLILRKKIAQSTAASFDRRRLQTADQEAIDSIFSGLSVPDWDTDIDEHMTQISVQLHERLCHVFPVDKKQPRKGYISDLAWQMRSAKMRLRHELGRLKYQLGQQTLREAFARLRWGTQSFCRGVGLRLFSKVVRQQRLIAQTMKNLQDQLRRDRTASLEHLAESSKQMPQRDFMGALRSLGVANAKKPSSIQPIPLLKGKDGEILDTAEKVRDCWRSYFQEQEDGVPSDLQTLLQEADEVPDRQAHLPSWSDLPTLFQLEHFFRRTAKGKAFFGDGIPGDLLAIAPKQMAELLYSCVCKEIAYVREPIAHKGGYLIPAFKKGDPSLPQNYRSLFVSSVVGKAIHAMYRQELAEVFQGCRLPFQIGGLKGHGITQAALVLQSFQRQAIRQKKSVCFFSLMWPTLSTGWQGSTLFREQMIPEPRGSSLRL